MRGRRIAMAIALALLAFAGIRADAEGLAAEHHSSALSCQLADAPVPEPGGAAIIAAAVLRSTRR